MATVYDIAKAAGVSYSTATRVLNGQANYTRPTYIKRAQRIRQIAEQMGYRPNAAARATSTGRFDAVGIVVRRGDKIGMGPHNSYIRGINQVLDHTGKNLVIAPVSSDDITEEQAPRILHEAMVDGLLIGNEDVLGLKADATLERLHIPSVWINSKRALNAVYPDDFGGAQRLTRHLLGLGHRRIAFIGAPDSGHYSSTDRVAGYAAAMKSAGLTPRPALWDLQPRERQAMVDAAFAGDDRPTAVLVIDGSHELALVGAAKRGLRVPEDLSVLALGHGQAMGGCLVDTYEIPGYWVGHEATRMLQRRIADPARADVAAVAVPYEKYIPGDTVAACPA